MAKTVNFRPNAEALFLQSIERPGQEAQPHEGRTFGRILDGSLGKLAADLANEA
jgi:hypothetical protein